MSQSTIFVMTPYDDKCQNLQSLPLFFALALTDSEMLNFLFVTFKKIGQDPWVQYSQWHNSMANVKIYKVSHTFLRELLPFKRYNI